MYGMGHGKHSKDERILVLDSVAWTDHKLLFSLDNKLPSDDKHFANIKFIRQDLNFDLS